MSLAKLAIEQFEKRNKAYGYPSECEECGKEYQRRCGSKYCMPCRPIIMSRHNRLTSMKQRAKKKRLKELGREIDNLYLYPQGPMWRIEKAEKELDILKENNN